VGSLLYVKIWWYWHFSLEDQIKNQTKQKNL